MVQIYGPFDQGDFRTMQTLKQNVQYYAKKNSETYGDTTKKYKSQLKEFFRKAA